MATKICSKCKTTKSLDDFHADKTKTDGKRSQCKNCRGKPSVKPTADHDHGHDSCIACIFGKYKKSDECMKRVHIIAERYRKNRASQAITSFGITCNDLGISDMVALKNAVAAKLIYYLRGKLSESEIIIEPANGYRNSCKRFKISIPESAIFTESDVDAFHDMLFGTCTQTKHSVRISHPCENIDNRIIQQCCAEYLSQAFPSLKIRKISYKFADDHTLAKWPKKFAMNMDSIKAAETVIIEKIIEML